MKGQIALLAGPKDGPVVVCHMALLVDPLDLDPFAPLFAPLKNLIALFLDPEVDLAEVHLSGSLVSLI